MTTSNRRRSKENAQVGDGDHATDEVRNNDVASELRSPQAGSPKGGRNPPKGTAKAQNTKRNKKAVFSFLYLKKIKFQKYMSVLENFKNIPRSPYGG